MALVRDLSDSQLTFLPEGGEPDQFLVVRYRGTEGLCQLYRFEIELVTEDGQVVLDEFVGLAASLSVRTADGERPFHGIISRLELTGQTDNRYYYRAELVPQVWLLTHRYNSRIFQNKTTQAIITDVIVAAGIANDRVRFELSATYEPREYCVQYRETDYNFIARLMEEEGIWWYFEQSDLGHVLVAADAVSAYQPITGDAALPFHLPTGLTTEVEQVVKLRLGQSVRPGAVALRDFDFENPALNLHCTGETGRDAGLEFSDYPGEYKTQARGNALAKIRAEEFEAKRVLGVGQSNCKRLAPARSFDLIEHPSASLNAKYVVTSATHQGKQSTGGTSSGSRRPAPDPTAHRVLSEWLYHAGQVSRDLVSTAAAQGGDPLAALAIPNLLDDAARSTVLEADAPVYECVFECIPAETVYRPPRVTPWPIMRGVQTARVVGPSGEEIHTDEYGRVKVQFDWDRAGKYDDASSCWIRVSQGSAGGQYGMLFLPRVGQEVIVDFLEGDPDKPIVTGRVYNADHKPPYTLPDEKTKSIIKTHSSKGGGGANEIRFEDLKDKEQLLLNAQKDFHVRVGNQERHNVKENQFLTVEGEQRVKIGGHRSVDVAGKDALHVADARSVVVDADVYHDFKAAHDLSVAGEFHVKAQKVVIEADQGISLKVGGNFVVVDSTGVSIKGSMIKLNSGGAAISSSISAQIASPAEPEEADEIEPGKDANYTGEPVELPKIEPKEFKGHWISIDLKDESGEPIAGEYYEITTPSGKVLSGTLDVNGFGRKFVHEEGDCQITFPRRGAENWNAG